MKEDLTEALFRDFPNLYSVRTGRSTLMMYGFQCGDGWEPVIRELSAKLESIILSLPESERSNFYAFQVKEKFGGLRFYMSTQTPEMAEQITEAENKSVRTCEDCGAAGELGRPGAVWIATQCPTCRALARNAKITNKIPSASTDEEDEEDS